MITDDNIYSGPHQAEHLSVLLVLLGMESLRQRIPFKLEDAEDDDNIVLDEHRKNKALFSVVFALIFD